MNRKITGSAAAWLIATLAIGLTLAVATSRGADFQVQNKIFVGDEEEPRVKSTTIFTKGVVYDFLAKPPEITIFDQSRSRFILLDQASRTKAELSADEVQEFIRGLRRRAVVADDPFIRFQADPKFDQQEDESSGELSFVSTWMTYRIMPADARSSEIAGQYRQFCDWQARLNTMLRPGSRLPFGRMIVNAELRKREQVPGQVQLTLTPKKGFRPKSFVLRSEHKLIPRLIESDRRRVAQAGEFMAIFKSVGFKRYQKALLER